MNGNNVSYFLLLRPCTNCSTDTGPRSGGWGPLCVICIRMMRQSMPLNDVTNRFGVQAINLRTKDRTLWDSKAKLLIYRYIIFNNYTLYPTNETRPEPIEYIASYTVNITHAIVIYCVERGREIQHQHNG